MFPYSLREVRPCRSSQANINVYKFIGKGIEGNLLKESPGDYRKLAFLRQLQKVVVFTTIPKKLAYLRQFQKYWRFYDNSKKVGVLRQF
jgi:hypothetical protein